MRGTGRKISLSLTATQGPPTVGFCCAEAISAEMELHLFLKSNSYKTNVNTIMGVKLVLSLAAT